MIKILLTLTLLLATFATGPAKAKDDGNELEALRTRLSTEWLLVKNDRMRKIRTYARLEDGKRYRSFKVEAVLDTRMEPLARVLLDFENYPKWFWKTHEARPYVLLKTTAVPDMLPAKPPLVRVVAEEMTIRFWPLPNNQVQMLVEGYFDPGGVVPPWAANLVQRTAPYAVMLAMQRIANEAEYRLSRDPLPFPVYNRENLP